MNPIIEPPKKVISDEDALDAIGKLEAEDNPSTEPEKIFVASEVEYNLGYKPTDSTSFTPTTTPKPSEAAKSEGPIVSGSRKSSKLTIVILILIIFLVIGGTIAYLKSIHSL